MDFRILGPLEVRDRGRPIELPSRKQRALLALFLLRPREAITSDALIDGLWGEHPPRTARAALQNYVAQLRRALGPGLVLSQAGGYLLDLSPEQIDLCRFERLAAEGQAATGEERVQKLRGALSLWRGPPLSDLAFEPFAAHEAGRLDELHTAALEDLIDARLAQGAGAELVGELEALVAEHPFRERLRGQLMLALYRAGRQAEALEAYQATRRMLVDELGIEPSTALRELEQAILRQDDSLAAPEHPVSTVAAPPVERRKTVTVLFADVACPEIGDPELLRETTTAALSKVRGVLEGHGGTIEQRAGDEVMAVFGVPRSHEDDALRAARAAVELKAEVAALAEALERAGRGRVELRVGIEAGEVLAGADDAGHGFVTGPAITLAKRLLQTALPDEALAGPGALRLLGDAVVAEAGERDDASRVLGVVEGAPALARHLEAPLVGRRAELAALHEALARAVQKRTCHLVLVLGEAGIGKTRLASELAAELDGDATVLVGRCVSYGKGATYVPLAEIIHGVRSRGELLELLAGDEHAELIAVRLAELTGEVERQASGGETFWAVRRFFEALAREQPVVLVFEDLHWAEPTLLDLIEYLVERVANAPVLLLGLARPELLEQRSQWAEAETSALAPLSSEEGEALIENLADVSEELRARIVRTAGGNPLFLEQLLAHATEEGGPERLPPSLEALLSSRLDLLEPGELAVLQRAAIAGREFSLESIVRLLAEDDATAVRSRLLTLVRKGLVHGSHAEPGREETFRFHHVLIRDAAYATLPKTHRAELHERFAGWLETRPTGSDELIGYHLEQAYRCRAELGPLDPEVRRLAAAAGNRLATAGLRAAKTGDIGAASNLLTRSISLLEMDEHPPSDLLTELGVVFSRGGDGESGERAIVRALEAALAEQDRRAELRARVELAHLRLLRAAEGSEDELLSSAREAIPVFEQSGDNLALGRVWYFLAFVHGGNRCHYGESMKAAEKALHYFRRSGWPLTPCLQELAAALYYGPTPVPEAIRRCHALAQEADRGGEANILMFLAGLEAMAGRLDLAREVASQARRIYEELGWTLNISTHFAPLAGDIELIAGEFAQAEELLAESCSTLEALGRRGHLATQAAQLGEAVYGQGRDEEALRWSEVAEECAATYDVGAQFSWRTLRARIRAREGAFGEAELLAHEAMELASATDSVSQRADVLLADAEVLRLQGRTEQAATVTKDALQILEGKGNRTACRKASSLLLELAST